jgi:hypothetical protein
MKVFAIIVCALFAGSAIPASASDADWAYISYPFAMSNGAVLFNTAGARGTPPACGAGLTLRYAINASTLIGQSQLSVLMTAWSMHKRVYVHGSGGCSIWGDTETADWIAAEN